MTRTLFIACTMIVLSGCRSSKNDTKLVFSSSMESQYAWTDHPQSNIVWSEHARSGNYVCKLDATSPYSVTYNMKVSDISKRPLKSANVSVWVYMTSLAADPYLGFSILNSSGQPETWISMRALELIGKPNAWHQVKLKVDLTEGTRNRLGNTYRIFAQNDQADVVFVDDLVIEYEEE